MKRRTSTRPAAGGRAHQRDRLHACSRTWSRKKKWEEASEIARRQVRGGAQVVDVCLQSTERDEKKDIPPFYES